LERQIDHGAYIELAIGPAELGGPGFIGHVSDALTRFGAKPLLVVCDAPAESVGLVQAHDNGLQLARLARARVAIVLGGREPTDADRLTEMAAANRGSEVRSFRELADAKAWLAVD
jgi:hypothetical protein